ncbi:MAG: glycine cleavage system protein GcvH [Candidatus Marinimicrobia bacterium]|nr:glycine cleavage system protein GcvH [Candidatus Neomarinimicrobiota bacterium]RKY61107.1 MAG: glycine cleavage system protein GcvH [Candidatus Neomarinimicrobiota bacterium]
MNVPEKLRYTNDHEWALIEGDVATVGVTEYAAGELGDVVYVELPEVGDSATKGDSVGTIEAVKTVADVYSPVSGEIVEVNDALTDNSELVNQDPYGKGWIFKIKLSDSAEVNELLTPEDYKKLI